MLNTMQVEHDHLIKALEEFIKQILPTQQNMDIKQLATDTANLLQSQMSKAGEQLTVDKLADPKLIDQVTNNINVLAGLKNNPVLIQQLNITPEKLVDPKFFNQLSVAMKLTDTIKNNPELLKKLNKAFELLPTDNPKFMNDLKLLLQKKNNPNIKQDFKNLLHKHLSPEQHGALLSKMDNFLTDMQKAADKKGKTAVDDPYVNLLGVLNSAITGAHPIPTPNDMGNALAIPDMNPYNGTANLDKAHNVNFSWGDSMGLESKTADTLESLGTIFASSVEAAGISMHASPSPFSTKPDPTKT